MRSNSHIHTFETSHMQNLHRYYELCIASGSSHAIVMYNVTELAVTEFAIDSIIIVSARTVPCLYTEYCICIQAAYKTEARQHSDLRNKVVASTLVIIWSSKVFPSSFWSVPYVS